MTGTFGVGLIGASPERGWARLSHLPAIRALDGLRLAAVLGRTPASAQAAAAAFGAERAHADPVEMFGDPAVDIVTVAVRVPDHLALVLGAIEAGKHVFCEWPLGRNLAEAERMAAAACAAGVKVVIGLQARCSPATRRAAALIADGAIGRVLGARAYSTTAAWGNRTGVALAFAEDPDNAVNLVTIQAMHTLDLAAVLLGGLANLTALAERQFPTVQVEGEAAPRTRRIFDHLLVQGRLLRGGTLAVEVVGGRPPQDTPFRFEVTGDSGTLVLEGGAPRGFQSGTLRLLRDGGEEPVDRGPLAGLPNEAVNVAALYCALRADIRNGTATAPGFGHAVRLTRLIDDVLASSAEGRRLPARDWPA